MTPKVLVIDQIRPEITAEQIANVFWNQHLARISTVVMARNMSNKCMALLYIEDYGESEAAYNLIKRLEVKGEARVVYRLDYYWTLTPYFRDAELAMSTTEQVVNFDKKYYEKDAEEAVYIRKDVTNVTMTRGGKKVYDTTPIEEWIFDGYEDWFTDSFAFVPLAQYA